MLTDEGRENGQAEETENEAPVETEREETVTPEPEETPAAAKTDGEDSSPGGDASGAAKKSAQKGEDGLGEEPPPFVPSYKFKAGVYNKTSKEMEQREYEIDPKFREIMKDPESAELVRSLHAKAYGLESIRDRFTETREYAQGVSQENTEIKASIDTLKTIYQSAVKSGNYHKLDSFFERLNIPQEVVMTYALEKARLQEMTPEQRQMVQGKLDAERRAEELSQQTAQMSQQNFTHAQQIKRMQCESVMSKPEVHALASAFDEQMGKPGAFLNAVERAGQLAWYQKNVDLTPEQAVQEVIEMYNLKGKAFLPAATPAAQTPAQAPTPGQKPVVQRSTKTIPNIQGRSTSPLKQKPRSIDDLRKLYAEKSAEG